MLNIRNETALLSNLCSGLDKQGYNYAVLVIKGSFKIKESGSLAITEHQEIWYEDSYFDIPGESSTRFENDTALIKNSTDVVINGFAWAPNNKPVKTVDVSLQVGSRINVLKVFGDRQWEKSRSRWSITEPEKFIKIPLRFEYAYGGKSKTEESNSESSPVVYPGNPIGKGFINNGNTPEEGFALPNIEDPGSLIEKLSDQPTPKGFGYIGRNWTPRMALAGTYDDDWKKHRMPLLPLDFNNDFFNGAHPDCRFRQKLLPGEQFILKYITEGGYLKFRLPNWHLKAMVRIKNILTIHKPDLDTVVIEPENSIVNLTWRVTVRCDKNLLNVDSIILRGSC